MKKYFWLIPVLLFGGQAQAGESVVQALTGQYQQHGAGLADAAHGKEIWQQQHMQKKLKKRVSCASCHGADLRRSGEHLRTGKRIEPMAPSVNQERLSDPKKIEKWFLRNCKWTWGRECTTQEKADILAFLQSL